MGAGEAGGGPYTIARWELGSSYEFTRFPDYWFDPENGITPIDTFVWRIIHESSTKRIAMETGEVQYGDWFTPEDLEALARGAHMSSGHLSRQFRLAEVLERDGLITTLRKHVDYDSFGNIVNAVDVGATVDQLFGYTGQELVGLLLRHPGLEIAFATSEAEAMHAQAPPPPPPAPPAQAGQRLPGMPPPPPPAPPAPGGSWQAADGALYASSSRRGGAPRSGNAGAGIGSRGA